MLPKNPAAEVVGLEVETNLVTWKQEWSCLKQCGIQWVWGRLPREAKAAGLWTTLQVNQSHSVVSDSFRPLGLHSPWDSPGQNTGMGSLSLLLSIFPTQGSNPGLQNCRRILYYLRHKGSPTASSKDLLTGALNLGCTEFPRAFEISPSPGCTHTGQITSESGTEGF